MDVFEDRRDPEYLKLLEERLTIDGPKGLLARAVEIATPRPFQGQQFTHCCRIDFAGIAATNLFDTGHNFVDSCFGHLVEEVFKRAADFNEHGIFVKMRFLLVYPF